MTSTGSPIDPSVLETSTRPLGESRTLPGEAYLSQQVFVLIVRDEQGALRGFFNVCRHRGHELLECGTSRNLRAIKCPYHAWVYGLDGALNGAPRFGDVPGFDKAEHPLVRARVREWNGWIFANASGDAPDFLDHVGNLDGLVRSWEIDRLWVGGAHEYTVAANWKTITENYHECYHCSSIHPALCRVTPTDSGEHFPHTGTWVGGSMELKDFAQTMSLTGESGGVPIRGLNAKQRREVYYFGLFPNLLISLHPDFVMTHRLEPFAPVEDEVHLFMAMVARGYLTGRVSPALDRGETAVPS